MTVSLIREARGRPGDDPIFTLNEEAQRRSAAGEPVINASLGALFDDEGRLAVMPTVFEAFRSVPAAAAASYAPIAGDRPFLDGVIADAFGDSSLRDGAVAVATPGGTGALLNATMNFLEAGQSLFTTSYFWSPYSTIASHNGRGVDTFEMFDANGAFHVDAFEDGLRALIQKQGRALVILNFPCHNPTGYTLDATEWSSIAEILVRASEAGPVAILLDLAYSHFGAEGNRYWRDALAPIADRVTVMCTWTASKSFAQYGSRVGALIVASRDEAEGQDIANAISYTCRASWSNCNHLGLLAIANILTTPELKDSVDRERDELVALLRRRVDAFNAVAAPSGLRYPRYEGGFFVSVFAEQPQATAKRLAEDGVFVVPIDGALRLALCSVPERQIEPLVRAVAAGIESTGA